jgi:hypothetical protein
MIPFLVGGYFAIGAMLAVALNQPGAKPPEVFIDVVVGTAWPAFLLFALTWEAWMRVRRHRRYLRTYGLSPDLSVRVIQFQQDL